MASGVPARIHWIPHAEGGRVNPPKGPGRYPTIARFDCDRSEWPDRKWTLVVELDEDAPGRQDSLATAHFLSKEAPHAFLAPGNAFSLYEGHRMVARGEILPPAE
jgi:hypothetical protein